MIWTDAIEQAKSDMGYDNEYVEEWEWEKVVERAKQIMAVEYEDWGGYRNYLKEEHQEYLKSERWAILRKIVLKRCNYKCQDCGGIATQVHHTQYDYIDTPWEIYTLLPLCEKCHKKTHRIKGAI